MLVKQSNMKFKKCGFPPAMVAPMIASLMAPMAYSLIQPLASSLVNAITGKGVKSARKVQEGGFLPLLVALPLMMKVLRKESQE